jgi:hypothetical protein
MHNHIDCPYIPFLPSHLIRLSSLKTHLPPNTSSPLSSAPPFLFLFFLRNFVSPLPLSPHAHFTSLGFPFRFLFVGVLRRRYYSAMLVYRFSSLAWFLCPVFVWWGISRCGSLGLVFIFSLPVFVFASEGGLGGWGRELAQ